MEHVGAMAGDPAIAFQKLDLGRAPTGATGWATTGSRTAPLQANWGKWRSTGPASSLLASALGMHQAHMQPCQRAACPKAHHSSGSSHADSHAGPMAGTGNATVATGLPGTCSAPGPIPAVLMKNKEPAHDAHNSTSTLSPLPGRAGKDAAGGDQALQPPGEPHLHHKDWGSCASHRTAQDLKNSRPQSEEFLQGHAGCRPERVTLVQQASKLQDGSRTLHLDLGQQVQLAPSPTVQLLPRQAAAAERRGERLLLDGAPIAAAPAAAAAGIQAAAPSGKLSLAPGGGQPLQTPANLSTAELARLYQDFERTTEQVVKDKLQEQRAALEAETQQRLEALRKEYKGKLQEARGSSQPAVPPLQQSPAPELPSPREEQLAAENGRLRQKYERQRHNYKRLKEQVRLQQEELAAKQAAEEQQRCSMQACGQRLGQLAEILHAGATTEQPQHAAQRQGAREQHCQGGLAPERAVQQLRQEAEHLRGADVRLQQPCPPQRQASVRDNVREGEARQKGSKRPRHEGSRGDEAERPGKRATLQKEVLFSVGQAFTEGYKARSLGQAPKSRGLRELTSLQHEHAYLGHGAAVVQRLRKHALNKRRRQDSAGNRAGRQQGAAPAWGSNAVKDRAAKEPMQGQQQQRAVPVTMDQVMLEWNGGKSSVLLARVRDTAGTWLCSKEVYRNLGSKLAVETWDHHIKRPGHAYKPATLQELIFLKAVGALAQVYNGRLISVDLAISTCGKAGLAAPALAAMAGIPTMQAHVASQPQARRLPAQSSGLLVPAAPANSLPPTPVPADTLSHRHGPRLASQPRAAHQQPEVQRVQPAAGSLSAKPGAQAAGRAAEGKLSTQLQQQQQPALPQGNRMLAATLSAGRAAVGTPQGQQQSMVPGTMDHVLLQWDGGGLLVLARMRDAQGCWLCCREVHNKLGRSVSEMHWRKHISDDGHGLKKATVEELRFLTAAGILRTCATNGTLVSLDTAIRACGMARVAAPVLAAMAGIPELQPTPAPPRQAQLLLIAPDRGRAQLADSVPRDPMPARKKTLSQPRREPRRPLETQRIAAQVPGCLEQVLLEWEGGNAVVLARIKDAAGDWLLCSSEVYNKLARSIERKSWDGYIRGGRRASEGPHRRRPSTPEEMAFLKAIGAHNGRKGIGLLSCVAGAISACGRAGVAAPVLAAMAGIADLRPYSGPLPPAQPPLVAPSPDEQHAQQQQRAAQPVLAGRGTGASAQQGQQHRAAQQAEGTAVPSTGALRDPRLAQQPVEAHGEGGSATSSGAAAASGAAGVQPRLELQPFGPKLPARRTNSKAAGKPQRGQKGTGGHVQHGVNVSMGATAAAELDVAAAAASTHGKRKLLARPSAAVGAARPVSAQPDRATAAGEREPKRLRAALASVRAAAAAGGGIGGAVQLPGGQQPDWLAAPAFLTQRDTGMEESGEGPAATQPWYSPNR